MSSNDKRMTIGDCVLMDISIGDRSFECCITGKQISELIDLNLHMIETLEEFECADTGLYRKQLLDALTANINRETTPLPEL